MAVNPFSRGFPYAFPFQLPASPGEAPVPPGPPRPIPHPLPGVSTVSVRATYVQLYPKLLQVFPPSWIVDAFTLNNG